MSLISSGRLALSVLALCALSACGGGGDSGSSSNQSLPEDGKVVVSIGTNSTPAGSYKIDAGQTESGTQTGGGEVFEYAFAYDTTKKFMLGVAFQRSNPGNYVVFFDDESEDYMCSGLPLSGSQLSAVNAAIGPLGYFPLTTVPTCPTGLTIKAAEHRFEAINLAIASQRAAKSVTLSANIGWTLDSGTVTVKDGELVVIDAGSSTLPAKTYTLNTTYGASYATYEDTSFGRLIIVSPENGDFDTGLIFVQGKPGKFIVGFNAQVAGAAFGTYKDFVCRSNAWTADELTEIDAASLPVCSNTISINETNRRAVYTNMSIPALESGGKAVVISATFSWPVPVQGSFLSGSGSGSGNASPAPATSTTPPISTSTPPVASPVEPAAASVG